MLPPEEYQGSAAWRVVVAVAVAALTGMVSLVRYELFRSGTTLPYYVQALYALAERGPWAVSSWSGQPILGLHGPLILLPMAYVMAFGGLGLVLVLQAAAVGIGFVYLDDWLVAEGAPWPRRRIVGWAYLLSTLLWGMVAQDLHPVVLAVPALMAAATLLDRGRVAAGLVALTVALLGGYAVLPVALLLGLVLALRHQPTAGAAAAAWAVAAALVSRSALDVTPRALLGLPSHPFSMAAAGSHALLYLGYLLVPVLVFGVSRGTVWLVPALAVMALNLWRGTAVTASPFAVDSAMAAPFLLMALAATVADGRFLRWSRLSLAVYVLMFIVFLGHEAGLRHDGPPLGQLTAVTDALAVVPPHAPVVAVPYTAAHLADRGRVLPLITARVWPRGSYVVVDSTYTASIPAGALPPVLARLKREAKIKYAYEGMWVFYLPHQERGL